MKGRSLTKASWSMTRGVITALAVLVLSPTSAFAYVENEYVSESGREQNAQAIEHEKEREAAVAASEQRKPEEERAEGTVQERQAEEEREAREGAERSERETSERERAAQEAHEARAGECVVPVVIGDSLSVAVRALRKADCALGRVSRSHSNSHAYHGKSVVIGEDRRAGKRLPGRTAIAIRLGRPKPNSSNHHT
jgi:hypothetical protein